MDISEIVETMRQLLRDLHAGWYIISATIIYLVINILRGKAGFDIPFVTKLWNKIQSKAVKTYIILGLFGLAGGLLSIGQPNADVWLFLDAFLGGIAFGCSVLGIRHTAKATMETDSVISMRERMKKLIKRG